MPKSVDEQLLPIYETALHAVDDCISNMQMAIKALGIAGLGLGVPASLILAQINMEQLVAAKRASSTGAQGTNPL